jgi:protein arginine kinase activator
MLCDRCGEKPAVIHRITTVNGKKQEVHLCEECARGEHGIFMDDTFSINALLSSLLSMGTDAPIKIEKLETVKCSLCGQTFGEFRRTGRLGCNQCYATYRDRLFSLLKSIHGNIQHYGKIPKRVGGSLRVKREIDNLKAELEKAIKAEEYERAAEIRDKIKSLNKKI